jgi:hypothetical protein
MIFETTTTTDTNDWRRSALKKYGSHISGIAFEVDSFLSLFKLLKFNNIPISDIDSGYIFHHLNKRYYFALDSCAPLDIVFFSKDTSPTTIPDFDSLTHHPNNVFRLDWMLLSASPHVESRLRKFFEVIGALKQHQGCCDYWRVGPADDFCFFRFEPSPKAKGKDGWLSIEPDNIYFAY